MVKAQFAGMIGRGNGAQLLFPGRHSKARKERIYGLLLRERFSHCYSGTRF